MDDGFQNPSLEKDFSLVVVDGAFGFGNGRMIPAGPLREPVERGLARADAVVLMGDDQAGVAELVRETVHSLPILQARVRPGGCAERIAGRPVVAFAGIGSPSKFFDTLLTLDCRLEAARDFPDHHAYDAAEIRRILEQARGAGAVPVTTAKDAVRLPPELAPDIEVLTITLEWDDETALDTLLAKVSGS